MDSVSQWIKNTLYAWGASTDLVRWTHMLIFLTAILVLSWIVDRGTKEVIVVLIRRAVRKTKNRYDDVLLERGVFSRLAHMAPALVVLELLPFIFIDFKGWATVLQDLTLVYMLWVGVLTTISFLNAVNALYEQKENANNVPIKGYIQFVQILLVLIAVVWALSILFNFELKGFLTGLGAFAAVLMLIFKDTILGVVASVQITANRMLSIGDWITMDSRKADGTVIDISVNTVKVQNWDKTIATIPTYALVSESFHNWRGMEESGGRRIKRSINIDMTSIQFITPELYDRLSRVYVLRNYMLSKKQEIDQYNASLNVDESITVNGRRMTNVGTFRKYVEEYLRNHPKINQGMTFLVRQLQPTEKGLPIEIYVFSSDQEWANYEGIQADIFDHVLAVIPQFELRVFQEPTGFDMQQMGRSNT